MFLHIQQSCQLQKKIRWTRRQEVALTGPIAWWVRQWHQAKHDKCNITCRAEDSLFSCLSSLNNTCWVCITYTLPWKKVKAFKQKIKSVMGGEKKKTPKSMKYLTWDLLTICNFGLVRKIRSADYIINIATSAKYYTFTYFKSTCIYAIFLMILE